MCWLLGVVLTNSAHYSNNDRVRSVLLSVLLFQLLRLFLSLDGFKKFNKFFRYWLKTIDSASLITY